MVRRAALFRARPPRTRAPPSPEADLASGHRRPHGRRGPTRVAVRRAADAEAGAGIKEEERRPGDVARGGAAPQVKPGPPLTTAVRPRHPNASSRSRRAARARTWRRRRGGDARPPDPPLPRLPGRKQRRASRRRRTSARTRTTMGPTPSVGGGDEGGGDGSRTLPKGALPSLSPRRCPVPVSMLPTVRWTRTARRRERCSGGADPGRGRGENTKSRPRQRTRRQCDARRGEGPFARAASTATAGTRQSRWCDVGETLVTDQKIAEIAPQASRSSGRPRRSRARRRRRTPSGRGWRARG
jgi:hypothetical protein